MNVSKQTEAFIHSLAGFLYLAGQGLINVPSASWPLMLGLKLPPFRWKWKYGGFCYTSETDSESPDENAKLHLLHSLASVLDSLLEQDVINTL